MDRSIINGSLNASAHQRLLDFFLSSESANFTTNNTMPQTNFNNGNLFDPSTNMLDDAGDNFSNDNKTARLQYIKDNVLQEFSHRCLQARLTPTESTASLAKALQCSDSDKESTASCLTETMTPVTGFDFRDSQAEPTMTSVKLDAVVWWNSSNTGRQIDYNAMLPSFAGEKHDGPSSGMDFSSVIPNQRLPGLMNMATNAFVKAALGEEYEITLLGTREMPKAETNAVRLDFNVLTGPLFFTWALQMLLPEMLRHIVHERESRSVDMMSMHGLGASTYWG
eukprot:scaffold123543_cov33-Prasinocladus_malaysianus.AAC.1